MSELETGDVGLWPAVLEGEYAGSILLNAMEAKLPKLKPDKLSQIAVAAIAPIARRIGRTDDMFFGSFLELRQLGFMLERLDNPAYASSIDAEAAAAAASLSKCFPAEVNEVLRDRDRVNHGLAVEIMRVARRLFVPEHYRPQPIPQGLGPLLEALFYEKFDNYRWLEEVRAVSLTFNRLARMCRLHPFFTL